MKKYQRPVSRQKSGGLYEKLFAISSAVGGNDFVAKQKKDATVWAKCSPLYFPMEVCGLCEAVCPLKNSRQTRYYTLCPTPLNQNERRKPQYLI